MELKNALAHKVDLHDDILPPSISTTNNKATHLIWDNFDLNEETTSGHGTSHTTHHSPSQLKKQKRRTKWSKLLYFQHMLWNGVNQFLIVLRLSITWQFQLWELHIHVLAIQLGLYVDHAAITTFRCQNGVAGCLPLAIVQTRKRSCQLLATWGQCCILLALCTVDLLAATSFWFRMRTMLG